MTSPDRHSDRTAVFDRDERRCRHCAADGDDDSVTLRLYPLSDEPAADAHESALVTVCDDCRTLLESAPEPAAMDNDDLFRLVRDTTGVQSATISDVAAFASLATSLPDTLESAVDDETDTALDDSIADYRRTRRDIALALDVVDARLERIAALESAVDPDVRSPLAAFSETAADLQSDLRRVVALGETVATGLERCHGCFAALEVGERACSTCGLAVRETADWGGDDGQLAFDRLFATINETLQGASTTTETLTDRTMTLAEQLTA
ncbi:HNH endonuclease [Natrinema marinum]|uniref:HNH endonuclease n=1 Tax=Natrinema marinum TaxID=2961598 RepID=UPI0020C840C5|nr:HNH endonuclease [Natrinema marinum]